MSDALRAAYREARDAITSELPGGRVSRSEIARLIDLVVRVARSFELAIPGRHYGGLTNQELLDVRESEGRNFVGWTNAMKSHVRSTLALTFEDARRMPTEARVREVVSAALIEWVLKRLDYKVRDVRIPLLNPEYQKRKRADGYTGPVGVRTGAWRTAIEDRAKVRFPD